MTWILLDWIAGAVFYLRSKRVPSWDRKNIYMSDSYDGYQRRADN